MFTEAESTLFDVDVANSFYELDVLMASLISLFFVVFEIDKQSPVSENFKTDVTRWYIKVKVGVRDCKPNWNCILVQTLFSYSYSGRIKFILPPVHRIRNNCYYCIDLGNHD